MPRAQVDLSHVLAHEVEGRQGLRPEHELFDLVIAAKKVKREFVVDVDRGVASFELNAGLGGDRSSSTKGLGYPYLKAFLHFPL